MGNRVIQSARFAENGVYIAMCFTLALVLIAGCDKKPSDADAENARKQHAEPAAVVPNKTTTPEPNAPSAVVPEFSNTIFGNGGTSSSEVGNATKDHAARHDDAAAAIRALPARPPAVPEHLGPTEAEARQKLEAATAVVERTLAQLPEYRTAKSDVDKAAADVEKAMSTTDAGSAERIEVAQRLVAAKKKLRKVVDEAAARNRACIDAKRELDAARGRAHLGN